jgi:ubiquinone/menaquinone biosynthesis methyltransferases
MFDSIAPVYDHVNRRSSFGLDASWRKSLIKKLPKTGAVLDLACGTGALSWAIWKRTSLSVIGLDLSPGMLREAQKHSPTQPSKALPEFIEGAAEALPFASASFEAVSIAFGIRNVADRQAALQEMLRVLKPGGRLLILEFATPRNRLWRWLFRSYFSCMLPLLGRLASGNKEAYRYLTQSVLHFPQYEVFCRELGAVGFINPDYKAYTGGVAVCYQGQKG